MKKYIAILLLLFSAGAWAQSDSIAIGNSDQPEQTDQSVTPAAALVSASDDVWNRANTAYINASYSQAIELYEQVISSGKVGYKLYYNLANAYFKNNQIGRSILYYNKALRLAPTDSDTGYNLAVANSYVKDKIEQVPQFFLKRWIAALGISLSENTWTALSLLLLLLALAGALMYLLPGSIARRKAGFYTAITCAVMFIIATGFALKARKETLRPSHGIVMSSAVSIKSSPDISSKDLFVIHEGTKVKVVAQLHDWIEVMIADGNKGWIKASAIEMI